MKMLSSAASLLSWSGMVSLLCVLAAWAAPVLGQSVTANASEPQYRIIGEESVGRLEVRANATAAWGSVCNVSFDRNDAIVACGSLNMSTAEVGFRTVSAGTTEVGPSTALAGLQCSGAEDTLAECPQSDSLSTAACNASYAVALSCGNESVAAFDGTISVSSVADGSDCGDDCIGGAAGGAAAGLLLVIGGLFTVCANSSNSGRRGEICSCLAGGPNCCDNCNGCDNCQCGNACLHCARSCCGGVSSCCEGAEDVWRHKCPTGIVYSKCVDGGCPRCCADCCTCEAIPVCRGYYCICIASDHNNGSGNLSSSWPRFAERGYTIQRLTDCEHRQFWGEVPCVPFCAMWMCCWPCTVASLLAHSRNPINQPIKRPHCGHAMTACVACPCSMCIIRDNLRRRHRMGVAPCTLVRDSCACMCCCPCMVAQFSRATFPWEWVPCEAVPTTAQVVQGAVVVDADHTNDTNGESGRPFTEAGIRMAIRRAAGGSVDDGCGNPVGRFESSVDVDEGTAWSNPEADRHNDQSGDPNHPQEDQHTHSASGSPAPVAMQ